MDKGGSKRCYAKAKRSGWNEPTGSNPLTRHVGRNFAYNVRDVEDGEEFVVIVAFKIKVFLKTGESSIAYVGSIDEAKQIKQSDRGNDVEVDLVSKSSFGGSICLEKCSPVSEEC